MKKLTLNLDQLTVESFDTAVHQSARPGTVQGNMCCCCCCDPCCCAEPTVAATCQASCNGTCDASCNGTCDCPPGTDYLTCAPGCGEQYTYGDGGYQQHQCYFYPSPM